MDYYNRIQRSIDYIERNLDSEVTLTQIADQAYCSLYHFHRIFQAMVGDSVKEYIIKRRLTEAASELINSTVKIIEIAFKYQYKTHESFSRAFYKTFGVSPNEYRKFKNNIPTFDKVNLYENIYSSKLHGNLIGPEIITKEDFKVIGVASNTTKNSEVDFKQIPKFWNKFFNLKLEEKIPNKVYIDTYLGYSCDFDEHSNYTYFICSEVNNICIVPNGMVSKTIPASKYATFKIKGQFPELLINAWRYIYNTWLPNSGYELTDKADIEELNLSRISMDIPEVTIYLPIK
ncbi:MAG: AraC family transcriptional regulator [Clostridiales bacterium]|nr:AraC family transcriptional regulator [Clostridiales bacterium]